MKREISILFSVIFFFAVGTASAEEGAFTKYDLCEISGYFSGRGESFMFGLATHHNRTSDPDFFQGSQCMGLFESGYNAGIKTSKGELKYSSTENAIRNKSADFADFMYSHILNNSGLVVKN